MQARKGVGSYPDKVTEVTDKTNTINKHQTIARIYKSGKVTTENIAKQFLLTPRQVQRICKNAGVIRSQAEANRIAAPLKNYRTVPDEFKVKRKHITSKIRYQVISSHPYCAVCGMRPNDGVRLEVDHIDEDPTNNILSNLQVLCTKCNTGKSHVARF